MGTKLSLFAKHEFPPEEKLEAVRLGVLNLQLHQEFLPKGGTSGFQQTFDAGTKNCTVY